MNNLENYRNLNREKKLRQLKNLKILQISVSDILGSLSSENINELKNGHHLFGASSFHEYPVLAVRVSKKQLKSYKKEGFWFEFDSVETDFGYGILWWVVNKYDTTGVISPFSKAVSDLICCGKYYVLFLEGNKFSLAYEINLSESEYLIGVLEEMVEESKTMSSAFFSKQACLWKIAQHLYINSGDHFRKRCFATDKLSMVWSARLAEFYKRLINAFEKLKELDEPFKNIDSIVFPECQPIIKSLKSDEFGLERIISLYFELMDSLDRTWDVDQWTIFKNDLEVDFFQALRNFYASSPDITNCGKNFVWLYESRNEGFSQLRTFEIDCKNFRKGTDPINYWRWFPFGLERNLGLFIKPWDMRILPAESAREWKKLKLEQDMGSINSLVEDKLNEASNNKKCVIPWGATVDLTRLFSGPFKFVELYEFEGRVYFLMRTESGDYSFGWVNVFESQWAIALPYELDENPGSYNQGLKKMDKNSGLADSVYKILQLNLSAIIRDFWVLEERIKAFEINTVSSGRKVLGKNNKPTIIYLPRVKYSGKFNIEACSKGLNYSERRSHRVRGHFRQCENPSKIQLIIAKRYFDEIPDRCTFVRPYEKGGAKAQIIYRSKSALNLLYSFDSSKVENILPEWEKFEKDTQQLMLNSGFEIVDSNPSARGDGGIDVLATRVTELGNEDWLIQCKCWSKKVGPSVIRELGGVLRRYPPGTRGMVVSASGFTSTAIAEADRDGTRLIYGEEFISLLKKSNNVKF